MLSKNVNNFLLCIFYVLIIILSSFICCACLAALGCSDPSLATRTGGNVWIDADPAIGLRLHDVDDGWAFVHAFEAFPGSLAGISLGHGNTESLEYQERITRELVANFAPNSPPVFVGAASANDRVETDAVRERQLIQIFPI